MQQIPLSKFKGLPVQEISLCNKSPSAVDLLPLSLFSLYLFLFLFSLYLSLSLFSDCTCLYPLIFSRSLFTQATCNVFFPAYPICLIKLLRSFPPPPTPTLPHLLFFSLASPISDFYPATWHFIILPTDKSLVDIIQLIKTQDCNKWRESTRRGMGPVNGRANFHHTSAVER